MTGITFDQLMGKVIQHRANNNLPVPSPDEIEDWICRHLIQQDQDRLCSPTRQVEWPFFLSTFKLLAKPGDRGLGDIIARTIGPVGGDAFKTWYKEKFGQDCGCRDRQIHLNRTYPL